MCIRDSSGTVPQKGIGLFQSVKLLIVYRIHLGLSPAFQAGLPGILGAVRELCIAAEPIIVISLADHFSGPQLCRPVISVISHAQARTVKHRLPGLSALQDVYKRQHQRRDRGGLDF